MSSRHPTARRSRRLARLVPLAAAGALLAGCGIHPGEAATIGGYSISRGDLDDAVAAQCGIVAAQAQQGAQQQSVTRAAYAQSTLIALVTARQQVRYGQTHDVDIDQSLFRSQLQQFRSVAAGKGLSSAEKQSYVDIGEQVIRGQLVALAVGARSLGAPLTQQNAQQAVTAGARTIAGWAARSGPSTSVDPRYGLRIRSGQPVPQDGSVSVPISTAAKQSVAQQPAQGYAGSLPRPQRCG